ncbi:hypothetical protein [Micromonospora sp. NBC_00860]|uniref:MmyB family transcriptional regulator n=1 Tax=Micromonospora sp. NBC_00860 TaxID=2975980 RepID=UPI00386EE32C|nr:hypothetical protein OH804_05945 [Micromonospora sp. NBC_00860]
MPVAVSTAPRAASTPAGGTKQFHHHVVGELTLAYESLDLRAESDLTLTIYAVEPALPTAQALALLASWAATAVDSDKSVQPQ